MKPMLKVKWISIAVATAFSGSAMAAGFALQNQNGSGNGNAFAGAAAAAEDAGTIFFNPAGMTFLKAGNNVALAATVLNRSIKFTNTGTTGVGAAGNNGGDAGGTSVIPAGYFSHSLGDGLSVGFGVSPTFGNTTEYGQNFHGRYSGYYAEMTQINLNPSVAYRISDAISVGGGLNFAKNETEFRQMVPTSAATGGAIPDPSVTLKGDDTAWGYNLGAMFTLSDSTRVGVAYRSTMEFDLEGTQTASPAPGGPFAAALPASVGVKAKLETPDNLSLAVRQQLSDRWEMLGDLTWTGWSSVKQIAVTRADGVPHSGLSYNFDDTFRVGLGANYHYSTGVKLRFGVAYDESPVKNDADRTMTLPDSDRTWLSFGAKFALDGSSSIDVGYTHIFFKKVSTARQVTYTGGLAALNHTVRGNFETSADLLSLQYNANF